MTSDPVSVPRLSLLAKLRRLVMWLLLVYASIPVIVKLCPSIQAKLVFLNFGESATSCLSCHSRKSATRFNP